MNHLNFLTIFKSMTVEEKLALFSDKDKAEMFKLLSGLQFITETKKLNTKNNAALTVRESEIFTMLLTGKAPKEIACFLKVSYHTIDFHRKNLYRKLGIQSRAELFAKYSAAAI